MLNNIINKLINENSLERDEIIFLLENYNKESVETLSKNARDLRDKYYGNKVFVRGLIEFTSYCKNDCFYCGLRKSNQKALRYRLTKDEILNCCEYGYKLGFRTFVLQGGEDDYYTTEKMVDIISSIKSKYKDVALTLSLGEKSYDEYKVYFIAGADRYLLRHETADSEHYKKLHPKNMSLDNRKKCLLQLKEIGFQVGAGFMIGSPYQGIENIADDLLFLKELEPHMIGIGPFIPHKDTPFKDKIAGTAELTAFVLAIVRLLVPKVLLPATTALGTIHKKGREMGLIAGANVVMPNLSPLEVREKYMLYDNKICTGDEAAECLRCIGKRVESVGMKLDFSRADHINA
jgi:biotin synthase